jgi:hypothetical protein
LDITKYDDEEVEDDLEKLDPIFLTSKISIGSSVNRLTSM